MWETQEVQAELYTQSRLCNTGDAGEIGGEERGMDPSYCPDKQKPRVIVEQYVALVTTEVAANLEGIAFAREERKPRQYQRDASIHETFLLATTGGGLDAEEGTDAVDSSSLEVSSDLSLEHFIAVPLGITSKEDMVSVLNFEHRLRLTACVKELLALPCMSRVGRRSEREHWKRDSSPYV